MQITTFGPLAVDGRPVRGARLATVIRTLVQARGRVVAANALIEAVWDGAPPDDAAGAVQALVSRVRRLGLPVEAIAGGYRLPADRIRVDAVEARALVDQARADLRAGDVSAAARGADQARALLPAVPDVTDPEASRLLADVAVLRAEAALAGQGPYDETDLRQLVARIPPDEPAAALLVRVLAAQGRDAEALAVVERLRSELSERYGTSPSAVVADAHVALLRGELGPPPAAPTPRTDQANQADQAGQAPRTPRLSGLPVAWRRPGTALVGRDADVAAVSAAVVDGPLVTVVATGGAGKTRLAGEVARRAAADGRPVRVVELAGLRSSDEVLPALLAVLGVTETIAARPGGDRRPPSPEDQLRLVAQELPAGLVVLDNCEHVLDGAAAAVAGLLAVTSTEVTVLATSRAPLGLAGEVVHRLGALPDGDALELLAARARAGGAVLAWDPGLALELCHRLDNLPLALELAAARLRHMPIDDVIAGLTDRFTLLDDALRGLPDRHASLWTMVDWSRELLATQDRDLLQRLAVVPAPFLAETAAAVAGEPSVARGLATLVEQSLLNLDDSDGGPPRYRMLETVREYGDVRLDAVDGRAAAMAGLVTWARGQAIALAADFVGPGQLVAISRCAADQDNLVAALRWSIATDDEPAAVDIAAALLHLWTVRGLHHEVLTWGAALLRSDDPVARSRSAIFAGRAAGRPLPNADRLAWACVLVGATGAATDSTRLPALARRALRRLLSERKGEVSARAVALAEPLPALESLRPEVSIKATDALIANPDPFVQGFGYFVRAAVLDNAGHVELSAADAREAYDRFETVGDHWGMGMAALGIGQWMGGAVSGADEWLSRGEYHLDLIGAVQDAQSARIMLDIHLALRGDDEAAKRLTEASTSASVEEMDRAQAHLGLAHLAWQQQRHDDAVVHAEAGVAIAAATSPSVPQLRVVTRVVAAILRLWVVDAAGADPEGADRRVMELLSLARVDTLSLVDLPVVGSWALGGAELAAYRGEDEWARELSALGARFGANLLYLFRPLHGRRLTAALGSEDDRATLLAQWRERPADEVRARISELMAGLLD